MTKKPKMTNKHVCADWFVRDLSLIRVSDGETWFSQWKAKPRRVGRHRLFAICNNSACRKGRYLYFDKTGRFVKCGPIVTRKPGEP